MLAAAAATVVIGVAGIVVAYELLKRPADIHNPNAIFKPEKPKKPKSSRTVKWPMYGLRPRSHPVPAGEGIKPPFKQVWRYTEGPLLEFPPVCSAASSTSSTTTATRIALDADTGKVLWERRIGRLNASTPTYSDIGSTSSTSNRGMSSSSTRRPGGALETSLPDRAESSPVVIGRTLYFGCEDGELFALSTRNGHVRWATRSAAR